MHWNSRKAVAEMGLTHMTEIQAKTFAAAYGLLEPYTQEESWTSTVTAIFVIFDAIVACWIFYTGLFFVCLLSWVNKLILKATEEPLFNPLAKAQQCLSMYNSFELNLNLPFPAQAPKWTIFL